MAQDTSTLGIITAWEKDAPLCPPERVLRIEEVYENQECSTQHKSKLNQLTTYSSILVFLVGSGGKEYACNAGDLHAIPGLGRSPGEGNGYPLQYSCPGNPLDREAWLATVHEVAKSQTSLSE